ncbi:MAG: hypothetical protein ABIP61_03750 [Burkholderiaceae bacterium]
MTTKVNRSMPRIAALQACALAERSRELRDAQRRLAELGESAGLHKDWLGSLVVPARDQSPGRSRPRRRRRRG